MTPDDWDAAAGNLRATRNDPLQRPTPAVEAPTAVDAAGIELAAANGPRRPQAALGGEEYRVRDTDGPADGDREPRGPTLWSCKIGVLDALDLPGGADQPLRRAVARAFLELTGREDDFNFSGWGGSLTPSEAAYVGLPAEAALLARPPSPDPDDDEPSPLTQLMGLILHVEAVHGCDHTEQLRTYTGLPALLARRAPGDRDREPLDVERLATAIHVARNHIADPRGREYPHHHTVGIDEARRVADAYRALAADSRPEQPRQEPSK